MPIIEMKKVFLLGHRQEREKIISVLHEKGAVELLDLKSGESWSEFQELVEPDLPDDKAAEIDTTLSDIRYCLDLLHRYYPVRKSFVQQFTGSKVSLLRDQYDDYISDLNRLEPVVGACRKADEKMARIRNEETATNNALVELKPWLNLALPLEELESGPLATKELIAVAVDRVEEFISGLAEKVPAHYFEEVSTEREYAYYFVIYLNSEKDIYTELLKEAAASVVSFPGFSETPAAETEILQQKLTALKEEYSIVEKEIEELLEHRPMLMACYDYLNSESEKQSALANLARTENSFLLEGWTPACGVEDLQERLDKDTETAIMTSREPQDGENVPVLLHNSGPVDAYEVVTKLYSTPKRGELDPTPYLAPFFFLFFGICLSDVGYGIMLSLLALFITRKVKLAGMGKQLIKLLFLGGISSVFFGILMGSFFGDLMNLPALWFDPLDDPMRMLAYCFAIGLFHIYFGMGLQAYRNIKAGRPLDAVFDQGIWFIFINGLVLLILPDTALIGQWLAIGGASGLILTQGRAQDGVLKKFMSGLLSLYNVTGYLSDVLSYSRLLALGLATGVIASAINAMGGMVAGSVFGTIVMVIVLFGGHIFNILISTLSSYVHTSRLQYIEFFGKFFEGGGNAFKPFKTEASYIEIAEPEAAVNG